MAYICLVAGHGVSSDGSWDCGCVDGSYTEAALAEAIVTKAVSVLRSKGHTVLTDVPGNTFNINVGTSKANAAGCDIYVSVHCDYNAAPTGTYPIIYPGSTSGRKLANALNSSVMSTMGMTTRGILERDDMEVTYTDMPACIFEAGSIRADITKLTQATKYGTAIANGILNYFGDSAVSATVKEIVDSGKENDMACYFEVSGAGWPMMYFDGRTIRPMNSEQFSVIKALYKTANNKDMPGRKITKAEYTALKKLCEDGASTYK